MIIGITGLMPITITMATYRENGIMVLMYPMLILSGAAWPRELMPAGVAKISTFLPLTYVVNLLRGLWSGQPWGDHLLDMGVLAAMLVLGVVISAKTFRWE
jgi:ABC-2 type transport system permease protein